MVRHRTPHHRRFLLGVVLLATVVGGSACTDHAGRSSVVPSPRASASAAGTPADMPRYLAAADDANVEESGTVIAASARPTVTLQGAGLLTMVIRDEGGGAPVGTDTVELRLAATTRGSAVWIIPAGDARAAVAYQIQRA
ncbi:MAG: hypothetical protein WA890_14760 [Micromonospora sp.]